MFAQTRFDSKRIMQFAMFLSLVMLAAPGFGLRRPAGAYAESATLSVCASGCDFVSIQQAIYAASSGYTIEIQSQTPHTEGDIYVDRSLTLQGLGADQTIVQAAVTAGTASSGVFRTVSGATVVMQDMTIRHGVGIFKPGGIHILGGTVTLKRVHIVANESQGGSGGAIFNLGLLTLTDSVVSDNKATTSGGAIRNSATLYVDNTTIRDNEAGDSGGGIDAFTGHVEVTNSTISGNQAGLDGAGISAFLGYVEVTNSTISGNEADGDGGGVFVDINGEVRLANTTVAKNVADADSDDTGSGGGVHNNSGDLRLMNTLVSENSDRTLTSLGKKPNCAGDLISDGYNLIGQTYLVFDNCTISGDLTGNLINVQPKLDPLDDNGGPTLTHALQFTSPAIDAGNPAGCEMYGGSALDTDQRGGPRHVDGPDGDTTATCDIGAYEYGAQPYRIYLPAVLRSVAP